MPAAAHALVSAAGLVTISAWQGRAGSLFRGSAKVMANGIKNLWHIPAGELESSRYGWPVSVRPGG